VPEAEQQHHRSGEEWLEIAVQAAEQRKPDLMVEALTRSGFLDGLMGRLGKQWGSTLPRAELEDAIGTAVDAAYAAVVRGRPIRNLGAWIWKVASNEATDRWRGLYARRVDLGDDVPDQAGSAASDEERLDSDRKSESLKAEALRLARRLLPRIGQGQIVDVMDMVIEAVEIGETDLPPKIIAESLGISEAAARTLVSRGFDRLQREARREGVSFPDTLLEDSQDYESDDVTEEKGN
jgi:DNA-directed RNA polymerase specialized sigma24 family protein